MRPLLEELEPRQAPAVLGLLPGIQLPLVSAANPSATPAADNVPAILQPTAPLPGGTTTSPGGSGAPVTTPITPPSPVTPGPTGTPVGTTNPTPVPATTPTSGTGTGTTGTTTAPAPTAFQTTPAVLPTDLNTNTLAGQTGPTTVLFVVVENVNGGFQSVPVALPSATAPRDNVFAQLGQLESALLSVNTQARQTPQTAGVEEDTDTTDDWLDIINAGPDGMPAPAAPAAPQPAQPAPQDATPAQQGAPAPEEDPAPPATDAAPALTQVVDVALGDVGGYALLAEGE